jgi:hypothetical protein
MSFSVQWLYDRIDGHEPALVFKGRKYYQCVVLDRPIRVFSVDQKLAKPMRPVVKDNVPYAVDSFAKDFLSKERSHGITLAAKRFCEAALANVTEMEDDSAHDSELISDPDKKTKAIRKSPSEVKQEINSKKFGDEPKPSKKKRSNAIEARELAEEDDVNQQILGLKPKTKAVAKRLGESGIGPSVVGTICAELGIDPKDARKKLRKAGMSAPYTDAAKIRSVLAS